MRMVLIAAMVAAGSLSGCATKEFVLEEAGKVDRRVAALEQALTEAKSKVQEHLKKNDAHLEAHAAHLAKQDQRLAAMGEQHVQTEKKVAENAHRLQKTEQGLQLVRVDLSTTQSHLDGQGKQIASLQVDIRSDKQTAKQVVTAQDQRITSTEQGLGKVWQTLSDTQAQVKTITQQVDQTNTRVAQQGKRVDTLVTGLDASRQTLTDHAQRLQKTEQGLQLVRVDLSTTQSNLDGQGKQIASLQVDIRSDKQTAKQVVTAQDQRITGTEQGLGKVRQTLSDTQAQVKTITQQVDQTNTRVAQQGKRVDTLVTDLDASRKTLTDHAQRLQQTEHQAKVAEGERTSIAATAVDALSRAVAAGKLAEGKLMYASVLNYDLSGFKLNHADLGEDAKAALKAFAEKLKTENANVYLEIQGHTDTSGKPETNRLLSLRRAEAVRDFLYTEGGIPLHRMAVFTYGSTRPLADNKTRAGRIQNRRVLIIVLK